MDQLTTSLNVDHDTIQDKNEWISYNPHVRMKSAPTSNVWIRLRLSKHFDWRAFQSFVYRIDAHQPHCGEGHECTKTHLTHTGQSQEQGQHHGSVDRFKFRPWASQSIAYRRSRPTTSLLGFFNRRKDEERKNVQKTKISLYSSDRFAPGHPIPSQTWIVVGTANGNSRSLLTWFPVSVG